MTNGTVGASLQTLLDLLGDAVHAGVLDGDNPVSSKNEPMDCSYPRPSGLSPSRSYVCEKATTKTASPISTISLTAIE